MHPKPEKGHYGHRQLNRIAANYVRYTTALAFPIALLFQSQIIFAQSQSDIAAARELFIEGTRLAEKGEWKEAREHFARSLRLKPASLTLYSLGVAQRQTDQWVEARESFQAFLAEPSTQATQPFEKPARDAIAELNNSIPILRIQVTPSHLTDLHIEMDGLPVHAALLDYPRPVNPGLHSISAAARGYKTATAQIHAKASEQSTATLRLTLLKNEAPSPLAAPSDPNAALLPLVLMGSGFSTTATGAAIFVSGYAQSESSARAGRTQMIAGGALSGLGLITAGVGLIFFLSADSPNPNKGTSRSLGPYSLHPSGISFQF